MLCSRCGQTCCGHLPKHVCEVAVSRCAELRSYCGGGLWVLIDYANKIYRVQLGIDPGMLTPQIANTYDGDFCFLHMAASRSLSALKCFEQMVAALPGL